LENRGTGSGPKQRPPGEWQTQKVPLGKEPDQGAAKTSRPTCRDATPGATENFTTHTIANRPGVVAQRALAPIPCEVQDAFAQAPGGFIEEHLVGGGFAAEHFEPGDDGNVASDSYTAEFARGSASKVTGRPITGKTGGKGMI
jgi:hypothetical protein